MFAAADPSVPEAWSKPMWNAAGNSQGEMRGGPAEERERMAAEAYSVEPDLQNSGAVNLPFPPAFAQCAAACLPAPANYIASPLLIAELIDWDAEEDD